MEIVSSLKSWKCCLFECHLLFKWWRQRNDCGCSH